MDDIRDEQCEHPEDFAPDCGKCPVCGEPLVRGLPPDDYLYCECGYETPAYQTPEEMFGGIDK